MGINGKRLSITEVARAVGVTPRTIMRWEKAGKIKKSKRDWRGWRFYQVEEVDEIRKFYETAYEYEELNGSAVAAVKETVLQIEKSKRDWRGWRFYQVEEVDEIRKFYETAYEYEELNGSAVAAVKETVLLLIALTGFLMSSSAVVYADAKVEGVTERSEER